MSLEEMALLEAVTDCLIPADQSGPGARDAQVVRYIERALATVYGIHIETYQRFLSRINLRAMNAYGTGFIGLSRSYRNLVLSQIEAEDASGIVSDETEWQTAHAERESFELIIQHTREGMFSDPSWGGNADYSGWKLIGYPGPRFEWGSEDQRLDVVIEPRYGGDVSKGTQGHPS